MTPADLAALLRALTQTVLTERGLDVAVLPETVTVERPRNPEHGDYATNIALQIGKRAGVAPRDLAQWLAEAFAAHEGVGPPTSRAPASSTCAWPLPRAEQRRRDDPGRG